MILVTVGLHSQGFTRLIRKMDQLAPILGELVIMQIGSTEYVPKNTEYFRFTSSWRILDLMSKADVIVSHGGASSIFLVLQYGKPLVIVPRLRRYGEHIDDHQIELARYTESLGRAIVVYDIDTILAAIQRSRKMHTTPRPIEGTLPRVIGNILKSTKRAHQR